MAARPPAAAGPPFVEPAATPTPAAEVEGRLTRLQATLRERELDAALIVQNADLFYLSGTVQQSYLHVPADGEATLFVRRSVERARRESPLERVVELDGPRALTGALRAAAGGLPRRVGLELDVLPVAAYERLIGLLPGAEAEDVGRAIVRQRAVKSPYEVERIAAAAALVDAVWEFAPRVLRAGLTEAEFAGLVEAEARRLGHQGVIRMRGFNQEMFYGQLLTGPSATVPSFLDTPLAGTGLSPAVAQGVSFRTIEPGDPIVFDFVAVREGYTADFTRMLSLGPLPGAVRDAYAVALEAQAAVAAVARPGVTCRAVYESAVAVAERRGLGPHFMGFGPEQVRFIGHGVGLELDELPVLTTSDTPLEEGMVFALEPKFVLPGVGAVGVENTFLVERDGLRALTRAPEEPVEVPLGA
ncbi:MAG: Xaa-Pro peptidase family protein [Thermoleophilia bacterium]|jgi:Xaa-Pro dipeptidase|nr:Xaa-Pro peptidase family protein [Thermoleophilia bacterium]